MFKRKVIGWIMAILVLLIRGTCRIKFHNDPRPELRKKKQTYIYCILHGQQMGAIFVRERKTGAMVSRSKDGEILVPSLRVRGVTPYRGSSNKGGIQAFQQMVEHSKRGLPTYFAVDGPKGPRGYVQRGIADLALQTNSSVLIIMVIPTRRWILHKAWDRFQIPKPFSRVDAHFTHTLHPNEGESAMDFRGRINQALHEAEIEFDPEEAKFSTTEKKRRKK